MTNVRQLSQKWMMTTVINVVDADMVTNVISNESLKNNLIGLAENYANIIEMLEWFNGDDKRHTNVIEVIDGIRIDLPEEEKKDFRTTLRVNDMAWNRFKNFCNCNKQFSQKDLISMALLEYMNKYSK